MKVISIVKEWAGYFDRCRPGKVFRLKEITEMCCEQMKQALDDNFIFFGEYDTFPEFNIINNFCISHCSPYPEGAVFDEISIKFCPFCGEEIIIKTGE